MNNANVAILNIRTQKHEIAKSKESADHCVGNRKNCPNAIDELSHKNEITVLGQRMLASDEASKMVQFYIDDLKPNAKYSDEDVLDRTHQKKKIRRWLKGSKTSESEKNVFTNIMDKLENNENIGDALLSDFEKITDKISKRNDKIKSLNALKKSHNKIINSEQKGNQFDVLTVEKIFKITSKTAFEMDGLQQREMQQNFHEKHFPDYPIIFTAVHKDESKDHCHLMHSGKNSTTGKFDYPDAEAKVIQNYMKEKGLESSAYGKTWGEYSEAELKEHGENWQDMNYENANKALAVLGVANWQFKKLEGQEKEDAHNKIKQDPKARKKITQREFNNAELHKEVAAKVSSDIELKQKVIVGQDEVIANKSKISKKLDEQIIEKKSILYRFKKEIRGFVKSHFKYLDSFFSRKKDTKKIDELAQATAQYANNTVDILPEAKGIIENKIDDISDKTGDNKVKEKYSVLRDEAKKPNSIKFWASQKTEEQSDIKNKNKLKR